MAIKDRAQLKNLFKSGLRPKESDFSDLIDSLALTSDIHTKPIRIFSALLRMDNDGIEVNRPRYVVRYNLLEPNTLGELTFTIVGENQINIENPDGILTFERRVLSVGTLRLDYNFDSIFESDEIDDNSIKLIFNLKEDLPSPIKGNVPIFYNLPIEIRVYDAMLDLGTPIPFPGGGTINPTLPADPGATLP